jgi:hypothetical protein
VENVSKIKVTIEGDMKMAGYIQAAIKSKLVDPDNTPITKMGTIQFGQNCISFEMESRI